MIAEWHKLQMLRKKNGYSQEQLADKIGIARHGGVIIRLNKIKTTLFLKGMTYRAKHVLQI